jgi:hypothetical protein
MLGCVKRAVVCASCSSRLLRIERHQIRPHHLERDLAPQVGVHRLVHIAHAPAPDETHYAIAPHALAGLERLHPSGLARRIHHRGSGAIEIGELRHEAAAGPTHIQVSLDDVPLTGRHRARQQLCDLIVGQARVGHHG